MLFCIHFSLSAAVETEDLKESTVLLTLLLYICTKKLRQGIFIIFGTVCSSYTGMQA